jgi:hypothetical protein
MNPHSASFAKGNSRRCWKPLPMRLRDPAITCFAALDSNSFKYLVLISFLTRVQDRTHEGMRHNLKGILLQIRCRLQQR